MSLDDTIKKEARTWVPLLFVAFGIILTVFILLVSIFHQYSTIITENSKTKQMTIAKNIAEAMSGEINQTKQGLYFFVESEDLKHALHSFTEDSIKWPLDQLVLSYSVYNSQIIGNMLISNDSLENPFWSLKQKDYTFLSTVSKDDLAEIGLWLSGPDNHDCFLSITVHNEQGVAVTAMLDLQLMYERMLSHVKLGEKGYALVKNSDGVVIMYHLREQIGVNAVTERQALYPDIQLDLASLEKMIDKQKQGKEGIDVYQSYWWNEENPKKITKIAAYCPVVIDNGFLIVSAVLDYKEITDQATGGMIKVILLTLLICVILFGVVVLLISSILEKNEIERRNTYLNQLNKTLLTLHDNEQMILHQQRLQNIGTMTSGIAHEFNNLLTPIMGYSTLMVEQMDTDNPYYDDVQEILKSSEKAKDIIQQILSLGKRTTETVFEYRNVATLLKKTEKMIVGILSPNVSFDLRILDDASGFFCNETQLSQIILNIVLNAEAAIGDGQGTIQVVYRKVRKAEYKGTFLQNQKEGQDEQFGMFGQITVTDDGSGMDEETCSKIFDPFFTTKSATGGTGLGLSIVQNIVAAHKGTITVTSKIGVGSCFSLTFPLAEALFSEPGQMKGKVSVVSSVQKPVRILLVDDNIAVLKVLQKNLGAEGFIVVTTLDPFEALSLLKKDRYTILVTDDYMQGMNGLDLALKAKLSNPQMPVLILTGLLRKEIVEAQQSKIIASYLIKPVSPFELVDSISKAIG
ncbi:signal transduction histidine kinase [Sphaerochaeta pleomorpha str. Grapes]|uniref:histidine kinase n=1 Tax=Sphaerochaeta pleomorpha (strain ATCC BAA-1885 / DSM 22778 / Grapes) TaxID=158190 RepID=G8QUK9_SPHPG|nr:ATP-binding protein [Sphaerochaeta pleomorpha]AEV30317.1 signal transduction histidine kinase [Sphaerochaeta pleomorpha str. Grapes]